MAVNYKPLWIELAKRELKKTEFQEIAGLSSNILANMGKNKYISMKNLEKICRILKCTPNDIMQFDFEEDIND